MNWQYTDATNRVVFRTLQSGGSESCLASTLPEGTIVDPYAAPPPIITPVSPRQIRQALTRSGLRVSVEATVAAGDADIKDWWEFSLTFERLHPQVIAMGTALGISGAQLDDLWALGATL